MSQTDSGAERWKAVAGFPQYEVSNQGDVRSLDRTTIKGFRKGILLSPVIDRQGYRIARLGGRVHNKRWRVARLVAFAFLAPDESRPFVNHKNGVVYDDRVENLEWVTNKENLQHAYDTGIAVSRFKFQRIRAKLTEDQAREIKGSTGPFHAIADRFGVCPQTVSDIKNGRRWKNI